MITFNILGCCILRDIFRINPCEDKFKVNKFIQSVSPVSIVEKNQNQTRLQIEDLAMFEEWSNFTKRNICFDFNKNVQKTIDENPSDYLLMDLSELRFHNDTITTTTNESYVVTRTKFTEILKDNIDKIDSLKNSSWGGELLLSDEELFEILNKYVDFLKRNYKQNQIIVVENYLQYRHIDEINNNFYEFYPATINNYNVRLKEAYDHLKTLLPDAFYVSMPNYNLGDANHLWGKDPLHFTDEYYQYLFKVVELIVSDEANKNEKVEELKNIYSNYFKLLATKKRMEYYIKSQKETNLLSNPGLEPENGNVKNWKVSLSKASKYDVQTHILESGDETNTWAILSQNIDLKSYFGKTLCFSVKYQTYCGSTLNLVLRYKTNDGKWVYHTTKHVSCDDFENIDSIVSKIPEQIDGYSEAVVCVYLTKPNSKAKITEAKLELGEHSSLF